MRASDQVVRLYDGQPALGAILHHGTGAGRCPVAYRADLTCGSDSQQRQGLPLECQLRSHGRLQFGQVQRFVTKETQDRKQDGD